MNDAPVGTCAGKLALVAGAIALMSGSLAAAQQPAAKTAPPARETPRAKVEQVIVVFKTHFDIGYTQLAREVVQRYRTSMIDKALAVCDASEKLPPEHRFVWTIPGWPMQQILWPGQTPQRRARVEKAVRDGRLVWHALAGTTHTESMGLEDLVRSLEFSSRLARQFGQPLPRDAKMTDVPCHTWVLPTVLRRAGVDFLHLGCNSASGSPEVPRLFWWEGPDGSRLLTMYTAEGYGTDLVPPADWRHKTWLALVHTGDNHGPPEPGEVQQLLDRAKKELPGVKIKMGRLSDFGDAILAEEKARPMLPVIRKDMPDTWIHGIMSMPQEAATVRRFRPLLAGAESLHTLLGAWGVKELPVLDGLKEWSSLQKSLKGSSLANAYENSFLYSEHTWGASSREYSPRLYGEAWKKARAAGKYKYAEESWREHGAYAQKLSDIAVAYRDAQVEKLAKSVRISGPRIVVYNPLPWPRGGITGAALLSDLPISKWRDADTGLTVACDPWARGAFLAVSSIPPFGYRTYVPVPDDKSAVAPASDEKHRRTMENEFFRVESAPVGGSIASISDKGGWIRSIFDKRAGRELVDQKSEYGFGQYLYERFDKDYHLKFLEDYCKKPLPGWADEFGRANLPPASEVRYRAASPNRLKTNKLFRYSPGGQTMWLRGEAAQGGVPPLLLDVTLHDGQPYVEIHWMLNQVRSADPWPQAGWVCLPFAVEQPQFRLGRLGSIIDPANDIAKGANFEMFALDSGLTITGRDGYGIGLCSREWPLVSLGRPGGFRYTREWSPRKPIVFVNMFNNIWGTNFQQWSEDVIQGTVRIWAARAGQTESDLITPAWAARVPCQSAYANGPAGTLPLTQSGLELSCKGVLVTAFGANNNGNGPGTLLRLWEQTGQDGVCRVRLPESMRAKKARLVDLRGQSLPGELAARDGWLDVPLTHFAPTSVVLDDGK